MPSLKKTELTVVQDTHLELPVHLQANSPLPMYTQLKEILKTRILEGTYLPNQQMPSESELITSFGVSRITVRHALGELQSEGLIFRVHGKGTFVSRPRAFQDLGSLRGFGTAMRQMGYETHSKVLSIRTIRPPQHVQEKLCLAKGGKVTELQRLRFLNREPISIDVSYLPSTLGARLVKEDLANNDVFTIMENNFQLALGHADLQISATIVEESMARRLRVEEGAPVLFIERVIHTRDGAPLEYEQLYYRGDAFQFKVRVDRNTTQATA
jgi:GntR family transcriptional regulator